jgi:hypothetical protein
MIIFDSGESVVLYSTYVRGGRDQEYFKATERHYIFICKILVQRQFL